MSKNVIISVYDKKNLDIISKYLIKKNYTIYSTGGTSDFLKKNNIPHIEISKYTKQKEILGGRVKTLHPSISFCLVYLEISTWGMLFFFKKSDVPPVEYIV